MINNAIDFKAELKTRERLEAYHIGTTMLSVYEDVFGINTDLRAAIVVANDFAKNSASEKTLTIHQSIVSKIIEITFKEFMHLSSNKVQNAHAAIKAAECIFHVLDRELNLAIIHEKANEALLHATAKKSNLYGMH